MVGGRRLISVGALARERRQRRCLLVFAALLVLVISQPILLRAYSNTAPLTASPTSIRATASPTTSVDCNNPWYTKDQASDIVVKSDDEKKLRSSLAAYADLHADILSGRREGKILRLMCPPNKPCEGWGDRLKGLFNVALMAWTTGNAFVIGSALHLGPKDSIADYYLEGGPRWTTKIDAPASHVIDCWIVLNCDCPVQMLSNPAAFHNATVIDVYSNIDCSFAVAEKSTAFLESTKIGKVPLWRSIMMQTYFPTSPLLETRVRELVPVLPNVGIHVRTGWITNDDHRHTSDLATLLYHHMRCFALLCAMPRDSVFLAIDNQEVMIEFKKALADKSSILITAGSLGDLGHNSRDPNHDNLVLRLLVEFEVLRRVPLLLASPSGFSLIAHRLRYDGASMGFVSVEECKRIKTSTKGFVYNVGNW